MATPNVDQQPVMASDSPISQLLYKLGLTRQDLEKRSNQMRQFLTAEQQVAGNSAVTPSNSTYKIPTISSAPAPVTPVKPEPLDISLPTFRQYDSMEAVIERQGRRTRRDKRKHRERNRRHSPSLDPPTISSFSLDAFMRARDGKRVEDEFSVASGSTLQLLADDDAFPVTPQRPARIYYREHTILDPGRASTRATPVPTPLRQVTTPSRPETPLPAPTPTPAQRRPSTPPARESPRSAPLPCTPPRSMRNSPNVASALPSSSPVPMFDPSSSPALYALPSSSPAPRIINLVSSPGPAPPMPSPSSTSLPYTLPPPPYSSAKPNIYYAAMVGCAILSSPAHRLTLQEIYDYITRVYPYFKRGETTWMNSIRHVLSTAACFRKVARERCVGRTLWAIWDEDLPCFEGGGFKKQFCKDMCGPNAIKRKRAPTAALGSAEPPPAKKARRAKKGNDTPTASTSGDPASATDATLSTSPTMVPLPALQTHPQLYMLPMFPSLRPTPQHQPYYATPVPAEVLFPPVPPYHRLVAASWPERGACQSANSQQREDGKEPDAEASSRASTSVHKLAVGPAADGPMEDQGEDGQDDEEDTDNEASNTQIYARRRETWHSKPASSEGSVSMPGLTPNRSSSSVESEMDFLVDLDNEEDTRARREEEEDDDDDNMDVAVGVAITDDDNEVMDEGSDDDDDDDGDGEYMLSTRGSRSKAKSTAKKRGKAKTSKSKAKTTSKSKRSSTAPRALAVPIRLPPMPSTPTPAYPRYRVVTPTPPPSITTIRVSLSPQLEYPTTPPPKSRQLQIESPRTLPRELTPKSQATRLPPMQLSPTRTPLSHKGLHMSPSASLAHYKSNLDPPRAHGGADGMSPNRMNRALPGTPERGKRELEGTPKRLVFPSMSLSADVRTPSRNTNIASSGNTHLSPYRLVASPFRTPGRAIFDPHDPATLLDEELSRLGEGSPLALGMGGGGGLFGKGGFLYESPSVPSPGRWTRWW